MKMLAPWQKSMMQMQRATIIAEVGCNHRGCFDTAKEMIVIAKMFCQVDVVKFQKRSPRELLNSWEYNSPHPEPYHSYGHTYGEHRENLEFTIDQHRELKQMCEHIGIGYSSSVWDMTSAREIASLQPSMIKVPSACNQRFDIMSLLADEFAGEIHVSLGMTHRDEEEEIVHFLGNKRRLSSVVLYACTSGYPVDFDDVALLEVTRLRDAYGQMVKNIGFSGHHLGIAIDSVAYSLGANYLERHFTLDRTWKGTDHAASLEPDGLRRIVRDTDAVRRAYQYKHKDILDIEERQRSKLKRVESAVAATGKA